MLTRRELRSAYRETSVVLYSVLLPLLLYPFLLWLMVTALTFIEGQQERRVVVIHYDEAILEQLGTEFLEMLSEADRVEVSPSSKSGQGLSSRIPAYDARLTLRPNSGPEQSVEIRFFGDRVESQEAVRRIREVHGHYLEQLSQTWFTDHDLNPLAAKPFDLNSRSVSASSEVGGYLLGALLPIGLLVMIALGGAYPAIDTTAGERERGTWETMRSCSPSMTTIVVSKYLFVFIVCSLSGLLNLFAMLLSIRSIVAPLLRNSEGITFEIGPLTMLILICGVLGVALFVAAALLLCAAFARTFREGQALTTPMFMLIALPVLPLSDPSLTLDQSLALVPLVNLALVWRQALQGTFEPFYLVQTALSLGVLVVSCLWLGSRMLDNEDLMNGVDREMSWQGFVRVLKGKK